jgi:hypothetical protein
MRIDGGNRWALGLGLGVFAAIAGGMVAANETVAAMNPFYTNQSLAAERSGRGAEIVDASFVQPNDALPDTGDLSYGRGQPDDMQYAAVDSR